MSMFASFQLYFFYFFIQQLKSVAHLPWKAFMYKVKTHFLFSSVCKV